MPVSHEKWSEDVTNHLVEKAARRIGSDASKIARDLAASSNPSNEPKLAEAGGA